MTAPVDRLASSIADRYKVEREIGQGGMATVYLAEDIRHHRKVAIKVLQPELSAVLGSERFLKEIELTANLQHPHILPLFDSGVADGLLYYVMPYVEGETLRNRLQRERQLPIADATRIATDVAGALEYAHKRGVIHRDIKPENILLQDGRPVVADFGIALAVSNAGGNRVTQTGISLGTPQYMSPEQATGDRQLDGRTDIYSLGAVAYEMMTGDPPHTGSSAQAVIAKVITEKPSAIHSQRPSVPDNVEYAVEKALAKYPADRWATAREFSDALEGKLATPLTHTRASAPSAKANWIPWTIAAAAVAASLAFAFFKKAPPSADTKPLVRFTITSVGEELALIRSASISRDGQTIVIAAQSGDSSALWVRRLDELVPHRLAGSDGATYPLISPDGKTIAFLTIDGKVRKVPLEGGTATEVGAMTNPIGVSWVSPDTIVAGMIAFSRNPGLTFMSVDGDAAGTLTTPQNGTMHHFPVGTQDGKTILFSLLQRNTVKLGVRSSGSTGFDAIELPAQLTSDPGSFYPVGLIGDTLYCAARQRIWSMHIDLKARKINGKPTDRGSADPESVAQLASNGTLMYLHRDAGDAVLLVRPDQTVDTVITSKDAGLTAPRWSPDGQSVAMSGIGGASGLYLLDRRTRTMTRLTSERINMEPTWSSDGTRITIHALSDGDSVAVWQTRDGRGAPERIVTSPGGSIDDLSVSPDGRFVAMTVGGNQKSAVYVSPIGGHGADAVLFAENAERPVWSPDGKWIVYSALIAGKNEILAQAYPSGGRVQLSDNGGSHPSWPRNASTVYFESGRNVMAVDVDNSGGGLRVWKRRVVWQGQTSSSRGDAPFRDYDMSAANELIALEPASRGRSEVVVELNWAAQSSSRR